MQYGAGPAFPDLEEDVPQELFPCELCGRSFTAKALQRHAGICGKVFQSKRKEFNAKKKWLPEDAEKAKPSLREQKRVEKELNEQKQKNDFKAKPSLREQKRVEKELTGAEKSG